MPIASIAAVPPLTTAVSTTVTPQQASQPPPLTPTPPPLVQQQVPPAPITPPISVAIATPAISQVWCVYSNILMLSYKTVAFTLCYARCI